MTAGVERYSIGNTASPWVHCFSALATMVCLSSVSEERKMILWPLNHPSKCLGKKKPITEKTRREKRSVDIAAIQPREVGVCAFFMW